MLPFFYNSALYTAVRRALFCYFFQVYVGSHAKYGEDGTEIVAERAIGRDDYGQPQFRKRSNMRQPLTGPPAG